MSHALRRASAILSFVTVPALTGCTTGRARVASELSGCAIAYELSPPSARDVRQPKTPLPFTRGFRDMSGDGEASFNTGWDVMGGGPRPAGTRRCEAPRDSTSDATVRSTTE